MQKERDNQHGPEHPILVDDEPEHHDIDNVKDMDRLFFKNDRLYKHRTLRVNYTTYDVRRAQDTINPNTAHKDIMVLRDDSNDIENEDRGASNRFLYARVLGIYHANVIYTGRGMLDYQPRRLEFLWVRWFQPTPLPCGWDSRRLDCVKFMPVAHEHAFGFLDPADVIRACHIIPRMALGKVHDDRGLSVCAKDRDDWQYYYINRSALILFTKLNSHSAFLDSLTVI